MSSVSTDRLADLIGMPGFLESLISSGHVVDAILAVLLAEIAVLAAWRHRVGHSIRIVNLCAAALPGACLLLALRMSLTGASPHWIALCLAASFPAHLLDLRLRKP